MDIFPNREIKEQDILNLVEEGGRAIGLGTFRAVFSEEFRVDQLGVVPGAARRGRHG